MLSMTLEGEITSWNPGAEKLFGYDTADAVGRHISLVIPENASEEFEELLADALAGKKSAPCDTEWLRQDGSRVDVALSISPLRDLADRTFGFSALLRDITERKRSEAELRRVWQRSAAKRISRRPPPRSAWPCCQGDQWRTHWSSSAGPAAS